MSLETWEANGWLQTHSITPAEMTALLKAARTDLVDAGTDISAAWRFAIAYNAGLRLCTAVLAAAGYRPVRDQKHYRTIAALPLILGDELKELAGFLDTCRTKRHEVTYEGAAVISDAEADELIEAVKELQSAVLSWLRRTHPALLGKA